MKKLIGSAVVGISSLAVIAFYLALFTLYVGGLYEIISDDQRYTTKDAVLAFVIFPYPMWVGVKEAYRYFTVSAADRQFEDECLTTTEALGVPRESRLRYCDCFTKTKNEKMCEGKVFVR